MQECKLVVNSDLSKAISGLNLPSSKVTISEWIWRLCTMAIISADIAAAINSPELIERPEETAAKLTEPPI